MTASQTGRANLAGSPDPPVILDISRLLSRVLHPTPSGVDRVEMAYARGLLGTHADRIGFAAIHPTGRYGRLAHDRVLRFLDAMEERWASGGAAHSASGARLFAAKWLAMLFPGSLPRARGARVYVQASPHHLDRPALVSRILAREGARFACLVHDLIPLEYPEYARPGGADLHRIRMDTVARYADGVMCVSEATLRSFRTILEKAGRSPRTAVVHLGTHDFPATGTDAHPPVPTRRYFICVGTIEPRKNHLLLLHIWRDMALRHGPLAIPKLVIVGRRGWENEQVVDLLDRCPMLRDCVEEWNDLPDASVRHLMCHAQALLLPSFAEGFGMPVTEALQLGLPVLCSDIPALREAGQDVPDYLDPLDGPGWIDAILDYQNGGTRRQSQIDRLAHWRPYSWADHMAKVGTMIEALLKG